MKDSFKTFVAATQNLPEYKKPLAFGIARIEYGQKSQAVLSATYPLLNWTDENLGSYAVFFDALKAAAPLHSSDSEAIFGITEGFIKRALELYEPFLAESLANPSTHKNIQIILELQNALAQNRLYTHSGHFRYHLCVLYSDSKCESVESAYLKLLALSLGKAPLRSLQLDGLFGLLQNVAWSGNTPYELEWLRENEIRLKMEGSFPAIDFVDKFPRYLMQVIPQYDNIRLLDSAKTRFGAYLGSGGYTQMPGASYVNFNAGALGACMNEGRISSSVIVGEGSDVGGGVNSSTGISLGDGCIVDGGIAVLAGTIFVIDKAEAEKIAAINADFAIKDSGLYKGRELSGKHGVHYRQDSKSGKMIAFRSNRKIELNADLH